LERGHHGRLANGDHVEFVATGPDDVASNLLESLLLEHCADQALQLRTFVVRGHSEKQHGHSFARMTDSFICTLFAGKARNGEPALRM